MVKRYLLPIILLAVGWVAGYLSAPLLRSYPKHNLPAQTVCHSLDDGSVWCPSPRAGEGDIRVVPPRLFPGRGDGSPLSS